MTNIKKEIYFSIIICCYNSEKYLFETLQSILNQTYDKWELILINDGSNDGTKKILNNFKQTNLNFDIKIIEQTNKGLAESRNIGTKEAKYEWIAILDHDDISVLNRLEIQKNDILKETNSKLFFGNMLYFNNSNHIVTNRFENYKTKENFDISKINLSNKNAFRHLIIKGCFIGSSTVVYNKYACEEIKGFDKKYIFITDYIFFLEIAKKFDIYCSDKVLAKWRIHSEQTTAKKIEVFNSEMKNLYKLSFLSNNLTLGDKLIILYKLIKKKLKEFISYE